MMIIIIVALFTLRLAAHQKQNVFSLRFSDDPESPMTAELKTHKLTLNPLTANQNRGK